MCQGALPWHIIQTGCPIECRRWSDRLWIGGQLDRPFLALNNDVDHCFDARHQADRYRIDADTLDRLLQLNLAAVEFYAEDLANLDRKSTRLNSSHLA